MLVYLFAINKGYISKLLSNKVMLYIGNISAYAFLIHQVLIRYSNYIVVRLVDSEYSVFVLTVISFVLTIIVTEIYTRIEKRVKRHSDS